MSRFIDPASLPGLDLRRGPLRLVSSRRMKDLTFEDREKAAQRFREVPQGSREECVNRTAVCWCLLI